METVDIGGPVIPPDGGRGGARAPGEAPRVMEQAGRILILGAGPTGLGAAYRLQELGYPDFVVLEALPGPGGLAGSVVDAQGFTWDLGGHVQFSHYACYDAVLDRALPDQWLTHERESWIWIQKRFIPYPFQNNIHKLDPAERTRALEGLRQACASPSRRGATNFREWIPATFGPGIADLFMVPYNLKVWAYPLEKMGVSWMGDRVAKPDLARLLEHMAAGTEDKSWGPNNKFRFPLRGGTGAIWKNIAGLLNPMSLRFNQRVVKVDLRARELRLASGERLRYDALLTSAPLNAFCALAEGLSSKSLAASENLAFNSVHVLGIGLRGPVPDTLRSKCWMYFPEASSPYYRVTVFSNYSPHHVPEGEGYWSLMAEVSESAFKPVDAAGLKEWTLRALREDGLIDSSTEIKSFWHQRLPYGYPIPFLHRNDTLTEILSELERSHVYSRGRFGGWKYEVSNQDHSFMQGVEWVDRLLNNKPEITYPHPDQANA